MSAEQKMPGQRRIAPEEKLSIIELTGNNG
jgi:hypothetical protein